MCLKHFFPHLATQLGLRALYSGSKPKCQRDDGEVHIKIH